MQDYKPSAEEIEELTKNFTCRWLIKLIAGRMDDIMKKCMYAKDMEELTGLRESYRAYKSVLDNLNIKYKDNSNNSTLIGF